MISSSSTFCPHSGRVIRNLSRHLHAVWHGTEALGYSNHPTEAAAFSYLAIIFGRIASGVFDIRSLTWDEWSYPEGVILPYCYTGDSPTRG